MGRATRASAAQQLFQELNNLKTLLLIAIDAFPKTGVNATISLAEYTRFTGLGDTAILKKRFRKLKK